MNIQLLKLAYRCLDHENEIAGCPCCEAVKVADLQAQVERLTGMLEDTADWLDRAVSLAGVVVSPGLVSRSGLVSILRAALEPQKEK